MLSYKKVPGIVKKSITRTYTNNCINKYSTREIEGETVLGMKSDFQKSTALISVAVFIKWTERG